MNRRGDCICAIPGRPPEAHIRTCPVFRRAMVIALEGGYRLPSEKGDPFPFEMVLNALNYYADLLASWDYDDLTAEQRARLVGAREHLLGAFANLRSVFESMGSGADQAPVPAEPGSPAAGLTRGDALEPEPRPLVSESHAPPTPPSPCGACGGRGWQVRRLRTSHAGHGVWGEWGEAIETPLLSDMVRRCPKCRPKTPTCPMCHTSGKVRRGTITARTWSCLDCGAVFREGGPPEGGGRQAP